MYIYIYTYTDLCIYICMYIETDHYLQHVCYQKHNGLGRRVFVGMVWVNQEDFVLGSLGWRCG